MKHRLVSTVVLAAALAAPVAAYAHVHPAGGIWVTRIDGTQKAGFTKTWSDGETQTYVGIRKAIDACWDQGGGSVTDRCLGYVDGTYPALSDWKRSLAKAN